MTCNQLDNRPSIRRIIGGTLVASAVLLGGFATSSAYADHRGGHDDHRGGGRHDEHRGGWGEHYHSAPPVVYGGSYYNNGYGYGAPPVVYGGPAVGISVPGLSIGIN